MAYKYDVFISYSSKQREWVEQFFFPLFKNYFEESVKDDVKIFFDKEDISGGEAWEMKIKQAVIHSKLMVSIFSPSYFRSEWCIKELAIMDYRQSKCGLMTFDSTNGIIIPIKVFDGKHFPSKAHEFQIFNFNDYHLTGAGFKKTKKYVKFQVEMKKWTQQVVKAYELVPEWDEGWREHEWINTAYQNLVGLISGDSNKLA